MGKFLLAWRPRITFTVGGSTMDAAPPAATYRFAGFVLDIRRGSLLTAATTIDREPALLPSEGEKLSSQSGVA